MTRGVKKGCKRPKRRRSVHLDEVDLLALLEADDGLLPVGRAARDGAATALGLAVVVHRAHIVDLLAEETLHRVLDVDLVRVRVDFEDILIALFAENGGLLAESDGLDDLGKVVHGQAVLRARVSRASP